MSECWNWGGYIDARGYGKTSDTPPLIAHRVVYEGLVGEIPKDVHLHHACGNKSCVNPDHLMPLPARIHNFIENGQATKTHCPQGHEYNDENTRLDRNGNRQCRPCGNEAARRYRARLKDEPCPTCGGSGECENPAHGVVGRYDLGYPTMTCPDCLGSGVAPCTD